MYVFPQVCTVYIGEEGWLGGKLKNDPESMRNMLKRQMLLRIVALKLSSTETHFLE